MKQAIYDYLVSELYPLPNCEYCQYEDTMAHRKPCSTCAPGHKNYKLSKARQTDIKKITRGLIKILKKNTTINIETWNQMRRIS